MGIGVPGVSNVSNLVSEVGHPRDRTVTGRVQPVQRVQPSPVCVRAHARGNPWVIAPPPSPLSLHGKRLDRLDRLDNTSSGAVSSPSNLPSNLQRLDSGVKL